MKCKITSNSKGEKVNIYINGVLHLSLIINNLQVQSWVKCKSLQLLTELYYQNIMTE